MGLFRIEVMESRRGAFFGEAVAHRSIGLTTVFLTFFFLGSAITIWAACAKIPAVVTIQALVLKAGKDTGGQKIARSIPTSFSRNAYSSPNNVVICNVGIVENWPSLNESRYYSATAGHGDSIAKGFLLPACYNRSCVGRQNSHIYWLFLNSNDKITHCKAGDNIELKIANVRRPVLDIAKDRVRSAMRL